METLALILTPKRLGILRAKAPGFAPKFVPCQWEIQEDTAQLLQEPAVLAAKVRQLLGDEKKYDLYLNLWPGAYSEILFSYDRKTRSDLKRLRQSELEVVFRGQTAGLSTQDLPLCGGKPGQDGKLRRIIFAQERGKLHLLQAAFAAQGMKLQRVAPMDAAAADAALRFWAPNDGSIRVCMMLDEACTSISFLQGGKLHALRTIPNGFNDVLASNMTINDLGYEECLDLIRKSGVNVTDENFSVPAIRDDVLRTVNRVAMETVKTLHTTFGNEAVIDGVLLCGNFVETVGLVDYFNTMLNLECQVAGPETLKPEALSALVVDGEDLSAFFPFGTTVAKGADLLFELKQEHSKKLHSLIFCGVASAIAIAFMVISPVTKAQLTKEAEAIEAKMSQPEYVAVDQLFNQRSQLTQQREQLQVAIENLPHGGTNTAGMIRDLLAITDPYGTVENISVDYNGKDIQMSFTTNSYDYFIRWQNDVTKDGRFTFHTPPSFNGNGVIYSINASMTATDFDPPAQQEGEEG